jgi:tetratricopeptide (TPR) repeat protein
LKYLAFFGKIKLLLFLTYDRQNDFFWLVFRIWRFVNNLFMLSRTKIENYLFRAIQAGVIIILFLPLVMHGAFFFPFIFPKNTLFHIATEIIFVSYLILAHLNPDYQPKFGKIIWSVFFFLFVNIIAAFAGISVYSSFWGNYERMSGIFHQLHLFLFFLVLVGVYKNKKDWHSFFSFSIFGSILMCFVAYAQYLNLPFLLSSSGGSRLSSTMGNPIFFAAYLLFNIFFLAYFFLKEERFRIKFFSLSFVFFDFYLIFSSILHGLFGRFNWQYFNFFKNPLLIESLNYPTFFIPFIVLQALIFICWLKRETKYSVSLLLIFISFFELFILYQTETRGAIIGLVVALAFLAALSFFFKEIKPPVKIISLIYLVFLLIIPPVLVLNKDSKFIERHHTLRRLATISLTNVTTESRLLTWQASWQGWTETPKSFLIGYGPENYNYAFNKYFPAAIYRDRGSQIWFDRAHNIIFDVGVTTGLIGLISYLSIIGLAVTSLFRHYQRSHDFSSSWLLIGLIVAYFLQNFFVFDTLNTEIPFYLFLGFIVFLDRREGQNEESKKEFKNQINYIYLAVVLIVLAFFLVVVNFRMVRANNYLVKALLSKQTAAETESQTFDYFKKAIDQSLTGRFEARQQLAEYAAGMAVRIMAASRTMGDGNQAGGQATLVDVDRVRSAVNYATGELEKSTREEPLNIRHYVFLASLYDSTIRLNQNNPSKTINLLADKIYLSPTRPQIYYEIGQSYAILGDFTRAQKYFDQGIKLAPAVIEDRLMIYRLYILFGQKDLAQKQLDYLFKELKWQLRIKDYQALIEIYSYLKDYDKMIEFQNKIIQLGPSSENFAQLALIYAKAGKNNEAENAINKAVELNPSYANEAEIFIQKLNRGELSDK